MTDPLFLTSDDVLQFHADQFENKRTGLNAAIVFLELNGFALDWPLDETEQLVLGVAKGELGKDEVANFIRKLINEQYGPGA